MFCTCTSCISGAISMSLALHHSSKLLDINAINGTDYNKTKVSFCCSSSGDTEQEIILPSSDPFYLLPSSNNNCQKVINFALSLVNMWVSCKLNVNKWIVSNYVWNMVKFYVWSQLFGRQFPLLKVNDMVHHSEFIRICDPGISLSNVTPPVPHIDQKDSCTQINLCHYASSSGPVRHGKGFYA